ncbi:MAG: aminotransferase class III-fold pyridoxal phosphate-dependent enzyme [Planctomycetaceae bacterium]|nr:aminotransferase class III-fold pyridoxal phosphate-dependent enzyme [Planctomycetaceae bacterium]
MSPKTDKSQQLYAQAKALIPGGTQLLSKRPELHLPQRWPAYYAKASGCRVWDVDGNEFIDTSYMGIGACVLGYADPDVNAAVKKAIDDGSMTTLNCPEEVALAQKLRQLHAWADMARYCRCGGEAMAIAVRIARAATGRDTILFCGYHGWQDWYLAANLADDSSLDGHLLAGLAPKGVARSLVNTAFPFSYNDLPAFGELIKKHGPRTAAVVMEPIRSAPPRDGFLQSIREQCTKAGIVLIFDEITAGWRLALGGAHLTLGVEPDMAVFAKAMSNGFPMAAVIGRASAMDAAQEAFISSTYWTERIGPAAALATIDKLQKENVPAHLCRIGQAVQDGWTAAAARHKLKVHVGGILPLGHFAFEYEKPAVLKTLFTQWMLDEGFLATTAFYVSFAHKDEHVKAYQAATDRVFAKIAAALARGDVEKHLTGPVCHSGFQRLT